MLAIMLLVAACGSQESDQPLGDDPFGGQDMVVDGAGDRLTTVDVLILPIAYESSTDPNTFTDQDTICFYNNALILKRWYEGLDSTVTLVPVNTPQSLLDTLTYLKNGGWRYDRVIIMGHGGHEGPLLHPWDQIGWSWPESSAMSTRNIAKLQEYGQLLRDVTDPNAWIYVGACNPGTSTSFTGFDHYLEMLSCITGRHTLGTSTTTACWDVSRRIKELEGPNRRNTRGLVRSDACQVSNSAYLLACLPVDWRTDCSGFSTQVWWGPCEINGVEGVCRDKLEEACDGTFVGGGACSGPWNIQCCIQGGRQEELCYDNLDNDLDGLIDCRDPDCSNYRDCTTWFPEDPGEPNDDASHPTYIYVPAAYYGLSLNSGDEDWYSLRLAPASYQIWIEYTAALGDLDMDVVDEWGQIIFRANSGGNFDGVELTVPEESVLRLRVYAFNNYDGNQYNLFAQAL